MIHIIKVMILYYLSIKPTHGYEIQRFIQINQIDKWTKIQSGSIYYALNKLEKEGLIVLVELLGSGAKARKIYSITDLGRAQLKELVKEELGNQISEIGSDKFIVFPLLNVLEKNEMVIQLNNHIKKLNDQKLYLERWQKIKVNEQTLEVEKISFEMMLSNVEYQIKWHNALIDNMEECISASKDITNLISRFDFSNAENIEVDSAQDIENLKYQILNNPNNAEEKLEQLIKILKK